MSNSFLPSSEDKRWEQEDEEDLDAVRAALAELQAGARWSWAWEKTRFVNSRERSADLLKAGQVVWITNPYSEDLWIAEEAFRAGRPIVAYESDWMRQTASGREDVFIVLCGDKPALARQTRRLLDRRAAGTE